MHFSKCLLYNGVIRDDYIAETSEAIWSSWEKRNKTKNLQHGFILIIKVCELL